jgi:hypothetical protein
MIRPASVAPTTISFVREAWTKDLDADVTVEAVDADGAPLGLPLLRVTFPAGKDAVVAHQGVDAYLAAASLRVVDMSPFPRPCDNAGGPGPEVCYWQIPRMR